MRSLFELGSHSILEYVHSGFKKIPSRVVLRTDNKQAEIENLNIQEIENLIIDAVDDEIMNESTEN